MNLFRWLRTFAVGLRNLFPSWLRGKRAKKAWQSARSSAVPMRWQSRFFNLDLRERLARLLSSGHGAVGARVKLSVLGLEDRVTPAAPLVTVNSPLTLDENATAKILASNLTTSDAESGSAALTYTITTAPAHGTLLLSGSPLTGTFTQADINAQNLSYQQNGDEAATDFFNFTVVDGDNESVTGAFNVNINNLNDAPNTAAASGPLTVLGGKTLPVFGLSVSDVDAGGGAITVTLTVSEGAITLLDTVAGGVPAAGIANNSTASVTLTGTVTAINNTLAATNGVVFAHPTVAAGVAVTLTVNANDNGFTGPGGAMTDLTPAQVTLNVLPQPTVVYVNAAFAGLPQGADPAGPALGAGYDAFATIQDAIDAVASSSAAPGTVNVAAGTYAGAVAINKAGLKLIGAQAAVDADTRFAAFTGGPANPRASAAVESIVTASINDPTNAPSDLVRVLADDVVFDGLTLDGSNAALGASTVNTTGGVAVHARRGVTNVQADGVSFAPVNGLKLRNTIVQNVAQRGVSLSGVGAATGNVIDGNVIRSFGWIAGGGQGVLLLTNAYADVTNNTIDTPAGSIGLHLQNFSANGSMTWSGNAVTVGAGGIGIHANLFYGANATLTVSGNTVNAATDVVVGDDTWGINIWSVQVGSTVQVTNNTVGSAGGQFSRGVNLWNLPTANTVTVSGGSIGRSDIGISLDAIDVFGAGSATAVAISNVTITGGTVGIRVANDTVGANVPAGNISVAITGGSVSGAVTGILVQDNTADGFTAAVALSGGVAVAGGTTGLRLDGAGIALTGATLGNTAFSGQTGNYITLANSALAGLTIDGTAATFGGQTGGAATLATNFATEDKIAHATDATGLGFVRVKAGNVFVTSNSGSIQRGVNLALAGDTVNVAAGTFVEDVTISTAGLKLLGAGPAASTISGAIGGSGSTVAIVASDVELAGFTITREGNTVALWNDPGLNTAGVSIQGQAIAGALIHDNNFFGNRTGIDINNSNGHTIRNNVISQNRTGLIFRNQTDNLLVTENAITDNFTVGIVFLDGSGGTNSPVQTAANSRFFNNNLSGNWYGQIVDRQTGGSLPAPGGSVKDFSGNWFGTANPVVTTANSTEPGYAAQIPVVFGGTATAPGGQPDVAGPASANFDLTAWLNAGTDTSASNGFQGDFTSLTVTTAGTQAGGAGRVQEGIDVAPTATRSLIVRGGSYSGGADATAAGRAVALDPVAADGVAATGIVDLAGNLALNAGDTISVQLNGPTAGSGYDRLNVAGTANITGATLTVTRGFDFIPGTSLTILSATGGLTGTFAGLPNGATVTLRGLPLTINYTTTAVTLSLVGPAEVWVNDNFAEEADTSGLGVGVQIGDTVGGDGVTGLIFGYNAFASVQAAIDAAQSGGTVHVLAGTYAGNFAVNKSLSLLGPNATIDPNGATPRVAEAILVPAAVETSVQGSTSGTVLRVGSAAGPITVVIRGLTIDGHNAALTGGRTLNGVAVHTGAGISTAVGSFDADTVSYDVQLDVQNNVIQNLERYGVWIGAVTGGAPARAGMVVSSNKIDNLPSGNNFGGDRGRGIAFGANIYGTVNANHITRVNVGWQDDNFYLASPGAGTVVSNNVIEAYHRGIFHNLQYQSATAATISGNTISAETDGDFAASATNFGIELASLQDAVSVTVPNNNVTGTVYGILIWNTPTTGTVAVSGGTLSGNQYGVYATTNDPQFGLGSGITHATISGVTIQNATVAGIVALDTTGNDGVGVSLDLTGGTAATGGPLGLSVDGPNATATVVSGGSATATAGTTVDNGGKLFVNGALTGAVTVNTAGTLGGKGTITGAVTAKAGSTVAPGTSPGTLTITGPFVAAGTLAFEVDTAASYDQIIVIGTVDLSGATITLIDPDTGTALVAPTLPGLLTLISNDAADPTAPAATFADGATVTINGANFRLYYNGGDGNDLVLVNAAQPAVVYVDDAFVGATDGTVVDIDPFTGGVQGGVVGVDAFATIPAAIGAVQAGGTVIVRAGAYANAAAIAVNKSVNLLADAGATVSAPTANNVFLVSAPNVTISGFTIQVDQRTPSGQRANPNAAVYGTTFDGLKVLNNTFTSAVTEARAIYLVDNALTQGVTIQGNTFGGTAGNFYYRTVELFQLKTVVVGGATAAEANTFNLGFAADLHLNFLTAGATALVQGNTFTAGGVNVTEPGDGAQVTIRANTFTPISAFFDQALYLNHVYSTATVLVDGNTFTARTDTAGATTAGSTSVYSRGSHNVTVTNNTFNAVAGATGFRYVVVDTLNNIPAAPLTAVANDIVLTGNAFNSAATAGLNGTAIQVRNSVPNPTLAADFGTLTVGGAGAGQANTFGAGLAKFIQLDASNTGGAIPVTANIVATNNRFDVGGGLKPPTGAGALTLGELFAVEDRIDHAVDVSGVGFVTVVPNNVYVTTNSFVAPFTTGADIQRGVNVATAGNTVHVAAGVFANNVLVNKSVTLLGVQAGVDARTRSGAETVVVTNGNQNAVFTVTANGVTIDGFTIDGDDPTVVGAATFSGADANVAYGITNRTAVANQIAGLTVANNVIRNVAVGVRLDGASGVSVGSAIRQNWFHDIGNFDFGYAVSLRTNFYADVTDNLMTKVWTGVHTNNFNGAGGPASWSVSGNEVHSYAGGLLYWLQFNGATGLTINNNRFFAETGAVANNFGVLMVSIQNAVNPTFTNNTVTGTAYGIGLFNVPTSSTITLGATNAVSGTTVAGVLLTNNLNFNPVGTTNFLAGGPGAASTVIVNGMPISTASGDGLQVNATGGTAQTLLVRGVVVTDTGTSASGVQTTGALAAVNVLNATITGYVTGVNVLAGTAAVHGSDLSGNASVIANTSGNTVNASGNFWGVTTAATIAALIANAGAGSVTVFNPWLSSGADTNAAPGFQPNYATLTAIPTDEDHATSAAGYPQPISTVGTVTGWPVAVGVPFPLSAVAGSAAVTLNADGTFTYNPNAEFQYLADTELATDTFTYTFTDAAGATQSATVSITVLGLNDRPTITVDNASVTVSEGTQATNTGTFADTDLTDVVTLSASIGTVTQNANGTWSWAYTSTDNIANLTVTITATDDSGTANNVATVTFTLNVTNVAPVVQSPLTLSATTIDEAGSVTVSGTVTDVGTADTQSVTILWGDGGTTTVAATPVPGSPGVYTFSADHTYTDDPAGTPDTYTISATATDDDGGVSLAVTTAVTVNNVAPTATIDQGASSAGVEGTPVTFAGTFTDPGAADDVNYTYTWTVTSTNGQTGGTTGTVATYTAAGTAVPAFMFTPLGSGTYTITLVVADKDGGASTAVTHTLAVANVAPVLAITPSVATQYTEGGAGALLLAAASITDAGTSDTITQAVVTLGATFFAGDQLGIDLGGGFLTAGTLPSGIAFAYDGAGTLTLSGSHTRIEYEQALALVRYRSTSADPTGDGTLTSRTFTFTVTDNGPTPNTSAPQSRTLAIVAINQAPVVTVPAAVQFINEDGAPGGPLVFSAANGNAISVVDVDADPAPVLVLLSATNGVLTLGSLTGLTFVSGDGTADASMAFRGTLAAVNAALAGLTFTPAANFNGVASVMVTVNDEGNTGPDGPKSDTESVAVVVLAVPDAPVATPDVGAVSEDSVLNAAGNVLANDTDADGDALTVTAGAFTGTYGTLTLNANGSWSYLLNNASPAVQALKAGQTVTDAFAYVASDNGHGGTSTSSLTITITGANDTPVATNNSATVLEDGQVTVNVLTAGTPDSDVDGDSLTVTAVGAALHGIVTFTGSTVTYTPNVNYNGPDSFMYTISDGNGGTATATVNVTVTPVNDAPVASFIPAQVATEDVPFALAVPAFTDVDGDTLTYVPTGLPAWLTFDAASRTFSGTPANGEIGGTIIVTATDGNGGSASATFTLTVAAVNDAPVAAAIGGQSATEDVAFTFTAPAFTDVDDATLTYTASSLPSWLSFNPTTRTFSGTPLNGDTGSTITLTATDSGGLTASATFTLTVTAVNDAPVAGDDGASTAEDTAVTLSVLSNDTDVDTPASGLAVTAVTQPAGGAAVGVVTFAAGSVTFTPAANFNGTATFTYTVSDGPLTDTATVTVTVTPVNDAPTAATPIPTQTATEGVAYSFSFVANTFADVDDATLTYTASGLPAWLTFNPTTRMFSGTPANGDVGGTITLTATDAGGLTASTTFSLTVTAVNDAPVAGDDTFTTLEDVAVSGNVLANDTDIDSPTLTVSIVGATPAGLVLNPNGSFTYTPPANANGVVTFQYTVSDGSGGTDTATVTITVTPVNDAPTAAADAVTVAEDAGPMAIAVLANDADVDGNALTVVAVGQGANGTVTTNGTTITYTPNVNFFGTDNIGYTISDGNGGTATAVVTITVTSVNDAPVAANDAATVAEDSAATTIIVLANDTDVEGQLLSVTAVTQGANGTVTTNGTVVAYAPAANFNGTDTFTYTVSDGNGGTATATVTVTVTPVNDPPTAANDTATVPEDGSVVVSVLANDSIAPDANETLTVSAVTQGANGAVATNGTTVTYTPRANFNGTDTFSYTISDGNGGTATATVTVAVTAVNDAPVAANDTATVAEDGSVLVNVLANDSTGPDANETLSVTAVTQGANGAVAVSSTGVTYTPRADFFGTDSFTYTISDGKGGTATATVAVTVTQTIVTPPTGSPAALLGDTRYVVGAGAGGAPTVNAYDGLVTTPVTTLTAYDASFTGGVRAASGDVNGDGTPDLVTITGPGTGVNLKVFDGVTGKVILNTFPFEATFTGGGYVATGDFNLDGKADIVVSADEGGGPRVVVFDGATGGTLADFFGIDDKNFRGGARVAVADMNGDGVVDLMVGAGFGGGPRVAGYDGKKLVATGTPQRLFNDFFAYEQTLRNGVFLAAGDVNGDGMADLVVGGGPGGGPRVRVFSGAVLIGPSVTDLPTAAQIANFFAGDTNSRGGVRLAVKDLDGDDKADVVTGTGDGAGSFVRIALGKDILSAPDDPLFAAEFGALPSLPGGIFVG